MNIEALVGVKTNPNIPEIAPGDAVRVSAKITEGGKERIQVFQGVVIKKSGGGTNASFTVRHVFHGVGVERTFLLHSPLVEKVEIVRHGKVRRAKLYYLRGLSGKAARRKVKRVEITAAEKQAQEQEHAQVQVKEQAEQVEPPKLEQEPAAQPKLEPEKTEPEKM